MAAVRRYVGLTVKRQSRGIRPNGKKSIDPERGGRTTGRKDDLPASTTAGSVTCRLLAVCQLNNSADHSAGSAGASSCQ
jgi:hypothetical protein